jgi:predicted anti-sigma-YlaC factor YlaD
VSAHSRDPRARCARHRQRVSLQADGELPYAGQLLLEAHLVSCGSCRAFRAELRGVTEALRSTALARPQVSVASLPRRLRVQPQRLALAGGLAVLGLAVTMSGALHGTAVAEVGALSPVQGLPVYSTPYRLEGLPVYTHPSVLLPTTAS